MFHVDVLEQQPPVHQVARIVIHRDLAGAHEQTVLEVADGERVDRESREQPAMDLAEKNLAANASAHLLLNQRADLLAPRIGADADANRHGRHENDREERDGADDDNEVASLHRVRSRVR